MLGRSSQGNLLTAHTHTNWQNMTTDSCLSECSAGNYTYAFLAYGNQCWCDTEIRNNASLIPDPTFFCEVRSSGRYTDMVSGVWGGILYEACVGNACQQNADIPAVQTAAPTWGSYWALPTSTSSTSITTVISSTVATNTSSTLSSSKPMISSTVSTNTSSTFTSIAKSTSSSRISISTAAKPTSTLLTSTGTRLSTGPTATSTTLACPVNNAQNFSIGTNLYHLACSTDLTGNDLHMVYTPSIYACTVACSNTTNCIAASWLPGSPGPCYMKSAVGQTKSSSRVWSVKLLNGLPSVPNILCPTNDGQVFQVPNSNQSQNSQNYPSSPSSQSQVRPNINSTGVAANTTSFQIQCGVDHPGNAAMVYTTSMYACLQACAGMSGCTDVSYVAAGGAYYLKTKLVAAVAELVAVGGVQRVWGAVVVGRT